MKETRKQYTLEQKAEFLGQIKDIKKSEGLSLEACCERVGISYSNYNNWTKNKKIGRRKPRAVLVTKELPAVIEQNGPKFNFNNSDERPPSAFQVAEILAHMNASSLRAFMSQGANR